MRRTRVSDSGKTLAYLAGVFSCEKGPAYLQGAIRGVLVQLCKKFLSTATGLLSSVDQMRFHPEKGA